MTLTAKQWRIIELVSEGLKDKEIAPFVRSTEAGIGSYLRRIFDETGMSTRLELALWYVSKGEREHHETQNVVDHAVASIHVLGADAKPEGRPQDHA